MKLYATTTSDRKDAKSGYNISKGLGGNDFIQIKLSVRNRQKKEIGVGMIELKYIELNGSLNEYDIAQIRYFKPSPTGFSSFSIVNELEISKGKQKKDERIGGDDRQFKDWPVNGA